MYKAHLKLPKDSNSEIYYDPKQLVVSFRKRKGKPVRETTQTKALRVVVQAYGRVIEDRFFPKGSTITIGSSRRNTFRIPTQDLPKRHPLLKYGKDGNISLTINQHFDGVLQIQDKLQRVSEAPSTPSGSLKTIQLPKGSRGCIEHGTLLIYFEEIPDPERIPPVPIFKNLSDPQFVRWLLVSLAVHLVFLLALKLWPAKPKEVKLEELPKKFQKIIIQPRPLKPFKPRKLISRTLKAGPQGREGEGARAPGREGRRGKGKRGSGRKMSRKDVTKTGVLDFFSKGKSSGVLDDLVGGSAVPDSVDRALRRGGRYGLPGERSVRKGKGLQGTGAGGGGKSASIGQGLGTRGRGGGKKGTGRADFGTGRRNVSVSASIDDEEVFIMGNIPKSVIAKIIQDHLGQIRYCYERQLTLQPDLRGKIVTTFVIGLEGRVTSTRIKQSSMNSRPVERCIMNVIRRMPFPKPGGGIVEVSYPFLFRVAG